MVDSESTLRDVARPADGPPGQWPRRIGLLVLLIIVVLGATGLLGVHSRTVSNSAGGYTLRVTYPQVARSGLDVPWRAVVHHAGGFPNGLTVAISTDYFRMFETQGFYPDADHMTNDGKFVYFTFDEPRGDKFMLEYDAYIQPASQLGKSATVEAMVGGRVLARITLHTWLVP